MGTNENLCMRKCGPAVRVIHPSRTHEARDGVGLVLQNNDETSIKGNLLFCFMNVFHVRDKAFPVGFAFQRESAALLPWIDGGMLQTLIKQR